MSRTTTRLSSKGQIVIPQALRERLRWKPGQVFDVVEMEDGVLIRPHHVFSPTTLDDVGRALNYVGPTIPSEALNVEALRYRDPYEATDDRD